MQRLNNQFISLHASSSFRESERAKADQIAAEYLVSLCRGEEADARGTLIAVGDHFRAEDVVAVDDQRGTLIAVDDHHFHTENHLHESASFIEIPHFLNDPQFQGDHQPAHTYLIATDENHSALPTEIIVQGKHARCFLKC